MYKKINRTTDSRFEETYSPPVTSQYKVISDPSLNGSDSFDRSLFLSSNITGKFGGSAKEKGKKRSPQTLFQVRSPARNC